MTDVYLHKSYYVCSLCAEIDTATLKYLATIPHVNSDTHPLTPLSMLFASIWGSFLLQALTLLLFQHPATLSRGKGSSLFL